MQNHAHGIKGGGGEGAAAPPPNGDLVGFLPDGQSVEQLWCGNFEAKWLRNAVASTVVANRCHHCQRQLSWPTVVATAIAACRQFSSPTVVTTAIVNCRRQLLSLLLLPTVANCRRQLLSPLLSPTVVANYCHYRHRQISSPTVFTTAIANCRQHSWQL